MWGIGGQFTKKLAAAGIRTALQLKRANDSWVRKNLGGVTGLRTVWELRGVSCLPLESAAPPKKQILCSRSFGHPVRDRDPIEQAVSLYATRAAEKLRAQESLASVVHDFLHTKPFKPDEPPCDVSGRSPLPRPTSSVADLIRYSLILLRKIYRPGITTRRRASGYRN